MTLVSIVLMVFAALIAWLPEVRFKGGRLFALLLISVVALGNLQTGYSGITLALPILAVGLIIGAWWLITEKPSTGDLQILAILALTLVVSQLRIVNLTLGLGQIGTFILPIAVACTAAIGFRPILGNITEVARRRLALVFIVLIVVLFGILKTPFLKSGASNALGISTAWDWFGFSYIAFRLLHVLLDYRIGRLQAISLRDFTLYVIFFPALTSGPIARVEQFTRELNAPYQLDAARLLDGGWRIGIGLFKKFVLADTLAYMSLSPQIAAQDHNPLFMWLALYAYAFRLYFDFSGLIDIVIGIGRLAGIGLPENFNNPYAKRTIQQFWNSWHITLSTWFRTYFFMPFSRTLMNTPLKRSRLLVVLLSQLSTMILIGLWHGVALNFVLWGAWHGAGLWLNRVITDRLRGWDEFVNARPALAQIVGLGSVLLTFHFVALGWVFFALGDPALIGRTFRLLFGGSG